MATPPSLTTPTTANLVESVNGYKDIISLDVPLVEVYVSPRGPKDFPPTCHSVDKDECFRMLTDFQPYMNLKQLKDEAMAMAYDFYPNLFEPLQSHFEHAQILIKQNSHIYTTSGSLPLHALVENHGNLQVFIFPTHVHQANGSKKKSIQEQGETRLIRVQEKSTSPIPTNFSREIKMEDLVLPIEDLDKKENEKDPTILLKGKTIPKTPVTMTTTMKATNSKMKSSVHQSTSKVADLESHVSKDTDVCVENIPASMKMDEKMMIEMPRRKKSRRTLSMSVPVMTTSPPLPDTSFPIVPLSKTTENTEWVGTLTNSKEMSEHLVHAFPQVSCSTPPTSSSIQKTTPSKETNNIVLSAHSNPPIPKSMDTVPTLVPSSSMEEKKVRETIVNKELFKKRSIEETIDELKKAAKKSKKGSKHEDNAVMKKPDLPKSQTLKTISENKAEETVLKSANEIVSNTETQKTQPMNVNQTDVAVASLLSVQKPLTSNEEKKIVLPKHSNSPIPMVKPTITVPTPVTTPVSSSSMEEKNVPETTLNKEPVQKRSMDETIDEGKKATKKSKKGSKHEGNAGMKKPNLTKSHAVETISENKTVETALKAANEVVNSTETRKAEPTKVNHIDVTVTSSSTVQNSLSSNEEKKIVLPAHSNPPIPMAKPTGTVPTPVTTPVPSSSIEEKIDQEATLSKEPFQKRSIEETIDELKKTAKKSKKGSKHKDNAGVKKPDITKSHAVKSISENKTEETVLKAANERVKNSETRKAEPVKVNNVQVAVASSSTATSTTKADMMKEIEKVFAFEPTPKTPSVISPSSAPSTKNAATTSISLTQSQLNLINQMGLPVNPKTLVGGRNRSGRM